MQQRISWIDYAKCIGIYLVVLGHLPIPEQLSAYIYSFHMPLFFFISGYLLKNNQITFDTFFSIKIRTLVIPYLTFSAFTYIFWLLAGRHFGSDASSNIALYKPAIGILYANATNDWMIHNIPLWFIPCLFVVEIVFYFIRKLPISIYYAIIACAAIGYIDSLYMPIRLPWGIDVAFTAIVFYGLGNILRQTNTLNQKQSKISYILLVVAIICFVYGNFKQGRVDLNSLEFNNIILFYTTACSGIFICIHVCKLFPQLQSINFISNHTLTILALHGLAISVIKAIMVFILHQPIDILENSLLTNSVIAFVAIILLVPCMFLFESYVPIVIGKKKVQKT